jgi:hypothetical protein
MARRVLDSSHPLSVCGARADQSGSPPKGLGARSPRRWDPRRRRCLGIARQGWVVGGWAGGQRGAGGAAPGRGSVRCCAKPGSACVERRTGPAKGPVTGPNPRRIPDRAPATQIECCSCPLWGLCQNAGTVPPSRGGNVPRVRGCGRTWAAGPRAACRADGRTDARWVGGRAHGRTRRRARAGGRTEGRRAGGRTEGRAGGRVPRPASRRVKSRSRRRRSGSNPVLAR